MIRTAEVKVWDKASQEYKTRFGKFHAWSTEGDEDSMNPVAIIEWEDGSVETIYAGNIKFIDRSGA